MTLKTYAALVVALALIPATSALAQEKSSPMPSHLPMQAEVCYGRVYDAQHLKQHPKQRVTSFHVFRDFTPDANSEIEQETRETLVENDGTDGRINVEAYVRFRDRKGVFSNGLSCHKSEDRVSCSIDCDGGSFGLRSNGQSLLVDNNGFVVVGGCGASDEDQQNSEYVRPGADDKTFRLEKLPLAQCVALRDARAPAWAKLGKPLRVRFDRTRPSCHARTYDNAHLRAHPKQKVRRIALLTTIRPGAGENEPISQFIVRIETRDGEKLEARATCDADTYSYVCQSPDAMADAQDFYLTRSGDDIIDRKSVV